MEDKEWRPAGWSLCGPVSLPQSSFLPRNQCHMALAVPAGGCVVRVECVLLNSGLATVLTQSIPCRRILSPCQFTPSLPDVLTWVGQNILKDFSWKWLNKLGRFCACCEELYRWCHFQWNTPPPLVPPTGRPSPPLVLSWYFSDRSATDCCGMICEGFHLISYLV